MTLNLDKLARNNMPDGNSFKHHLTVPNKHNNAFINRVLQQYHSKIKRKYIAISKIK